MKLIFAVLSTIATGTHLNPPVAEPYTPCDQSIDFHNSLKSAIAILRSPEDNISKNLFNPLGEVIHYPLTPSLLPLLQSKSLDSALELTRGIGIDTLVKEVKDLPRGNSGIHDESAIRSATLDSFGFGSPSELPTIVVVPGIFGEFIKVRPFEEVLNNTTSLAYKQYIQLISQYENQSHPAAMDQRFDLGALRNQRGPEGPSLKNTSGYTKMELRDLINVASVDKNGKMLAKIVFLRPIMGSLETLGDTDAQARVFNRRLEKYFELFPSKNIFLLGYSRGTAFALAMAEAAMVSAGGSHLSLNLKGVISYAGVVFGSTLADDIDQPESNNYKLIRMIKQFIAELDQLRETPEAVFQHSGLLSKKAAEFHRRTELINRFRDFQKRVIEFAKERQSSGIEALAEGAGESNVDLASMVPLAIGLIGDQLGLGSATLEVNDLIVRVETFLSETITGASQLSTKERTAWWQKHVIPAALNYYSLPAVMVDPSDPASLVSKAIFQSGVGYSASPDDYGLIGNFRSYRKLGGNLRLNDSQVSVAQASFLPFVLQSLNPKQHPVHSIHLGILSSHHWGISLHTVKKSLISPQPNPFPRAEVLVALAKTLSNYRGCSLNSW